VNQNKEIAMKPSVLCVDDEPDITEAVRLNLLNEDIELDCFNDPKQGLEAAKQKEYTVALVDIRMPGMSGIEFLSALRELSPRTIQINMSSHADLEVVLEALHKNHVYDFIKKPLKREKFLAVLRKAIKLFRLEVEREELSQSLKEKNAQLKDWNSRLDEEVKKKTLELTLRNRLMQNLAGCGNDEQNSYAIIKDYFSAFYPDAHLGLYLRREKEYEIHSQFDKSDLKWKKVISEDDLPLKGDLSNEVLGNFLSEPTVDCGYIFRLERNKRHLGFLCLSQPCSVIHQSLESAEQFATLVSLVVYDELASERLSEISLSSLLKED
jgi:FixJ family two-component response regulator